MDGKVRFFQWALFCPNASQNTEALAPTSICLLIKQKHDIIHVPYVLTKELARLSNSTNIHHQVPYNVLTKEMARLSNSTDPHFLRAWLAELGKQKAIVQRKLIFRNLRKELEHLPQSGNTNNEHHIKSHVNSIRDRGNHGEAGTIQR